MKINEIFRSLDGEVNGFLGQGEPTTFIRLQGCNLHCPWCDTPHALEDVGNSKEMTVEEVMQEAVKSCHGKVTITGGEPLLQAEEVVDLIQQLAVYKIRVTLETNGSIAIPDALLISYERNKLLRIVADYKPPSSGQLQRMNCDFKNLEVWDIIKFLVADPADVRWAKDRAQELRPIARKIMSPVICGSLKWARKVAKMVAREEELRGWQFNLQIHKVLGIR